MRIAEVEVSIIDEYLAEGRHCSPVVGGKFSIVTPGNCRISMSDESAKQRTGSYDARVRR